MFVTLSDLLKKIDNHASNELINKLVSSDLPVAQVLDQMETKMHLKNADDLTFTQVININEITKIKLIKLSPDEEHYAIQLWFSDGTSINVIEVLNMETVNFVIMIIKNALNHWL